MAEGKEQSRTRWWYLQATVRSDLVSASPWEWEGVPETQGLSLQGPVLGKRQALIPLQGGSLERSVTLT